MPTNLTFLIAIIYLLPTFFFSANYLASTPTQSIDFTLTWTMGCFCTAHLLSIGHNSGRYWTIFLSLGLLALVAVRIKTIVLSPSELFPPTSYTLFTILYLSYALTILYTLFTKAVSAHFDEKMN